MHGDPDRGAVFFGSALLELRGAPADATATRILDFDCGAGDLVKALARQGFDARGCDMAAYWPQDGDSGRFALIEPEPYRLPFAAQASTRSSAPAYSSMRATRKSCSARSAACSSLAAGRCTSPAEVVLAL